MKAQLEEACTGAHFHFRFCFQCQCLLFLYLFLCMFSFSGIVFFVVDTRRTRQYRQDRRLWCGYLHLHELQYKSTITHPTKTILGG